MDNRGIYRSVLLSLILGTMVVSLGIYFIFNEIWAGDDSEREVCRQSIQLRNLLPEVGSGGINIYSFKEDFPLKCKTHVVEINEDDVVIRNGVMEAERKIAEAIAECWALYDKGDTNAFPTDGFGANSVCVPCARIHLTDEAKEAVGDKGINIENALKNLRMEPEYSYYSYLMNSGKKFSAFSVGGALPFNLSGDSFEIEGIDSVFWKNVVLKNKLNGAEIILPKVSNIILPQIFNVSRGDLIINYGVFLVRGNDEFGYNVPYIFYFQSFQDVDPFKEVRDKNLFGVTKKLLGVKFCEEWDGIPA